jgi:alkylation response protein AidB-like acyl-CoA dehydrogenase
MRVKTQKFIRAFADNYHMISFISKELEDFRLKIRKFSEENIQKNAGRWDENEEFPFESHKALADEGILGLGIPEEYGGTDSSKIKEIIATEEIARVDSNTAILMELKSLFENTILFFGNEKQKKTLKEIASGRKIPAFAFTEPAGGTDVGGIKSTAIKKNGTYYLTGSKNFITNALVADYFVVFAKTAPELREKGISAFLVEKNTPNFRAGPKIHMTGMRGTAISSLYYENSPVSEEAIIGSENMGFKIFSTVLERARVTLSAGSLGMMQRIFEESVKFASNRKSGGLPIMSYQYIQNYISEMLTDLEASRLLVYNTAMLMDLKKPISVESTATKLFVTEALMKSVENSLHVSGGYGYTRGTVIERFARDAHASTLGLGSSEAMRIILTHLTVTGARGRNSDA